MPRSSDFESERIRVRHRENASCRDIVLTLFQEARAKGKGIAAATTDRAVFLLSRLTAHIAHSICFDMALDQIITVLNILLPIAKTIPVVGTPLEGGIEAAIKICEIANVGAPFYTYTYTSV